jgi:hypothetical protein
MEQEAAQELREGDRQGTLLIAIGGVSPAKSDVVLVDRDQAVVGNGDAVSVAAEILQNMFGTSKGWFAVNHPLMTEEWPQESGKGLRVGQELPLCVNNSETSSPSTISVGAEKDSHLHEQDQW